MSWFWQNGNEKQREDLVLPLIAVSPKASHDELVFEHASCARAPFYCGAIAIPTEPKIGSLVDRRAEIDDPSSLELRENRNAQQQAHPSRLD